MKKYDLIIFDLDGVLLDTSSGSISSVKHVIKHFNLKPLTNAELLTFIGPPIQDSFERFYGFEKEKLQDMANEFRSYYKQKDLLKACLYPQILNLFEQLVKDGYQIGVATYKRQDYAQKILKHFGFLQHTNLVFGADNENKFKKVDIIKNCISGANVKDFAKVVMVGDTANDAIGAAKIPVDFIGVSYGFGFKNEADIKNFAHIGLANNAMEILKIIRGGEYEN